MANSNPRKRGCRLCRLATHIVTTREQAFDTDQSDGSFDKDTLALWNANFGRGLKIAEATDVKEAWSGKGPVMPTSHLHGGAIMGKDTSDSVTNSYDQTHEVANLWMAGPCTFPTEGASNPTYTIFATALHRAERLAKTWGSVAG